MRYRPAPASSGLHVVDRYRMVMDPQIITREPGADDYPDDWRERLGDLLIKGFAAEEAERTAKTKPSAIYAADSLADVITQRSTPTWLIEDLVLDDTLNIVIGPEDSGKSFVAIDMAMCIAHAMSYHHKRTVQRPVLYIAGEGRSGVVRRMRAWLQYHGIDPATQMSLGRAPIELMSGASILGLCEWVRQCIAQTGLRPIVVIDTISRNFGAGDENKTADMTHVIANIDRALRAEGATVILVHHTPIESTNGRVRSRGSSSLPAAADAIFAVLYDPDSQIHLLIASKMKDAPLAATLRFRRRVEDLGELDNLGRPVTSCVMLATNDAPTQKTKEPAGKVQRAILAGLRQRPDGMTRGEIAQALPELDRRNLYRAVESLIDQGTIAETMGVLRAA